jgi:hypothetical protein
MCVVCRCGTVPAAHRPPVQACTSSSTTRCRSAAECVRRTTLIRASSFHFPSDGTSPEPEGGRVPVQERPLAAGLCGLSGVFRVLFAVVRFRASAVGVAEDAAAVSREL